MLDVPMYFVFRDGKYIDAAGQSFRDFLKGELPALPGEKPHHGGLDRPHVDRFPRGAAEKLPGNARRRWRALEPDLRAAGILGRAALRPGRAGCGVGPGQGLDDGRARGAAQCGAPAGAGCTHPRRRRAGRPCARGAEDRSQPDWPRAGSSIRRATTKPAFCRRWTRSPSAARCRRRTCSSIITATGMARSRRSTTTAFDGATEGDQRNALIVPPSSRT